MWPSVEGSVTQARIVVSIGLNGKQLPPYPDDLCVNCVYCIFVLSPYSNFRWCLHLVYSRNSYYFSKIQTGQSHCRRYPLLILFPYFWSHDPWGSLLDDAHGQSFSPPSPLQSSTSPYFLHLFLEAVLPFFLNKSRLFWTHVSPKI